MFNRFLASSSVCVSFSVCVPLLQLADITKGCLNRNDFDHQLIGDTNTHAYPMGNVVSDGHESSHDADPRDQTFEHPCIELRKVLSSGTFYYSVDFDITNRLQSRYEFMQPWCRIF